MKRKLALALCAALMLGTVNVSAETEATESTEYLYGYTQMSYADFWYGEIENPAACDTFDTENPDLTATSEEYLHYSYSSADDADPYAGVQKNTWDNDSGMYDVVSRATVGYGLFRGSFANVVEVKEDDGTKYTFSNEIVADENAPTGYTLNLNTTEVPGVVFSSNTRLDTDNSTGYTPDTNTVYTESVAGYQLVGLKSVPVKVKKSTVEAAQALTEAGTTNAQLDAFMAQYEKITFVDESEMTSYACKELYANGIYSAREVNANAQVKSAGTAYLGNGENGTKAMAHGDGYADLTMYVYLDAFDGYTKGSVTSLDEETLNTLYEGEEKATYAENKEAGDKLAAFMDYALHFQGAKLQWAGADGVFDTEDDVFAGNVLHRDCYFSFNHGNYIEVSITNSFERFANLGNGDYRITLISEGYADVTVEADSLVLDYKTPTVAEDDVPALADGETEMKVQLSTEGVKVSNDESVTAAYVAGLENAASYTLSYTQGSGRKAETVVVCESASSVENNDGVLTVSFDVSGKELPTDIHYTVSIASDVADAVDVEFHYAPAE
jgi:hypothetical protein